MQINPSSRFSSRTFLGLALAISAIVSATGCEISGNFFTYTGPTAQTSQQGVVGEEVKKVRVSNQFGDVIVNPTPGGTGWTWEGKVWGRDQEQADRLIGELVLNVESDGETQTWRLEMPVESKGLNGVESNLTIQVPPEVQVEINNQHGNVKTAETEGKVTIDNAHGNVTVANLNGDLTIANSHGNLVANKIAAASINVRHGDADVQTSTGSLEIDSAHGRVNLESASGDLTYSGSHSSIKAANINGDAKLTTSHGNLDCQKITGNVVAENRHGSTSIATLGNKVQINSAHGKVELEILNSAFNTVNIENRHGDTKVILPQALTPRIAMDVDHGDAQSEFKSDDSSSQHVILTNRHGNIRVTKSATSTAPPVQAEAVPVAQ